jgi:hypothetical protein
MKTRVCDLCMRADAIKNARAWRVQRRKLEMLLRRRLLTESHPRQVHFIPDTLTHSPICSWSRSGASNPRPHNVGCSRLHSFAGASAGASALRRLHSFAGASAGASAREADGGSMGPPYRPPVNVARPRGHAPEGNPGNARLAGQGRVGNDAAQ